MQMAGSEVLAVTLLLLLFSLFFSSSSSSPLLLLLYSCSSFPSSSSPLLFLPLLLLLFFSSSSSFLDLCLMAHMLAVTSVLVRDAPLHEASHVRSLPVHKIACRPIQTISEPGMQP